VLLFTHKGIMTIQNLISPKANLDLERLRRRRAAVAKLGKDKPVTFESLKVHALKSHDGKVITKNPEHV
jgi:hypothetical protein